MAYIDVNIKVPLEMAFYLNTSNEMLEMERNGLLIYPYILNQTISYGHAAKIFGIRKNELVMVFLSL